ncbi:receptor-like protein CLAVATA2 [Hevea brasiliensis]|uniref:receptor-like protein CLAVATA2 n=1 Tax=Hevea brasiliensis TaxID=3981 RepID=UPI0025D510CE|nr:receptor-like protein CLAVATA2 [Hevea brasiliensis]
MGRFRMADLDCKVWRTSTYHTIFLMKEGYRRFPGAFAGNPGLCLESFGGGCSTASLPAVPRKSSEEIEGPISVWVFCLSAFVSFYFEEEIMFSIQKV